MSPLTPRPLTARMHRRDGARVGRLLFVVLLVAACANEAPGPHPAAPAASPLKPTRIVFDLAEFDSALTHRELSRDLYSGNELHQALFVGADSFAVVVLVKPGPGYVLEPRDLSGHVTHMLPATAVAWGDGGSVRVADRSADYRWFELPDLAFRCFAFDKRWRPPGAENGEHSALRQAFGFYCRAADRTLADADVRGLLPRIGFMGDV